MKNSLKSIYAGIMVFLWCFYAIGAVIYWEVSKRVATKIPDIDRNAD